MVVNNFVRLVRYVTWIYLALGLILLSCILFVLGTWISLALNWVGCIYIYGTKGAWPCTEWLCIKSIGLGIW